jgi:hypothetical protein
MKVPSGYVGPTIEIILKDTKADNLQEIIDGMLNNHIGTN